MSDDKATVEDDPHDALLTELANPGTWWLHILRRVSAWSYLVPWPLRIKGQRPSGWMTVVLATWLYAVFVAHAHLSRVDNYAADAAKILFSGAFLVGTVLSLSIAIPGQAVMRVILKDDPEFALDFVIPFLWSFAWGIAGALLMMFFGSLQYLVPCLPSVGRSLRIVATFVAAYAAGMELNALFYAIRIYLVGLVLMSAEESKKAADSERPPAN